MSWTEEKSQIFRTWMQNNQNLELTEASVKLSKTNTRELSSGLELLTVQDMVDAKFSKLLG